MIEMQLPGSWSHWLESQPCPPLLRDHPRELRFPDHCLPLQSTLMGFIVSNAAAAASLGWGKRSWQVNHAKDLNGGAGTSQRDTTCSQVPGRKGWGTGRNGAAGGLPGYALERWGDGDGSCTPMRVPSFL